jgi:hypothetical protein
MNMKNFATGLFFDETGKPSMKRMCGLLCTVALCTTMYHNSFTTQDVAPSNILVESVAMLAFGCLGLSTTDKIFGKKKEDGKPADAPAAE